LPTARLDLAVGTRDLAVALALAVAEAAFIALIAHGLDTRALQQIGAELARLHRDGFAERAPYPQAFEPTRDEIALGAIDTRLVARAQSGRLAVAPLAGGNACRLRAAPFPSRSGDRPGNRRPGARRCRAPRRRDPGACRRSSGRHSSRRRCSAARRSAGPGRAARAATMRASPAIARAALDASSARSSTARAGTTARPAWSIKACLAVSGAGAGRVTGGVGCDG
jgi:hypothetical protein